MSKLYNHITYYQAIGFYFEIQKIKTFNPSFNDELVNLFEQKMAYEISKKTKLPKTLKVYKIPIVMLNQLLRVTKFNIYDKELIKKVKEEYKLRASELIASLTEETSIKKR